ncbi:MAG: TauD/TfdA family dioxygenase [Alphaproteobacteria bacterium]|jgi:taurine dioxygenase
MAQQMEIRPISGALGAEIHGIDLGAELDNSTMAEVRQAYFDHGVVFFMDQDLTPEQHLAFARRFGAIDINKFFEAVDGYPEIAQVRKEADDVKNIGGGWHTDHSYDEIPAMGSMLYAKELPAYGGDTMFASMYAAHEALSPGMRAMLGGLRAVHSGARAFGPKATYNNEGRDAKFKLSDIALEEVEHPVICTHAGSGRKYLYVNGGFTMRFANMTEAESKPLLDYLIQHAAKPEFTCRFNWRPGAMAFWDNLCTQHFAINDYDGQRRLMHRVTIQGRAPQA